MVGQGCLICLQEAAWKDCDKGCIGVGFRALRVKGFI